MKKISIILIILLLTASLFAQEESAQRFQTVLDRLIDAYNAEDYEGTMVDYSEELLKELPPEKAKPVFEGLMASYGKIDSVDPPIITSAGQAVFRAHFGEEILDIILVLDDKDKIIGLLFVQPTPEIPVPEKNQTALALPFKDQWFVFWGGNTVEENYHHDVQSQRFAFDFVMVDGEGKSFKENGKSNEDYYCFGKEVLAPADGIVTDVIEGVRDNFPGSMNPYSSLGNAVFIQHTDYEVSVLAHFKMNSIKVKVGQPVTKGEVLGLCGNSGNSSEPHIHYHLQNTPIVQFATGIKCFFQNVMITKGNETGVKAVYSPVKGDIVGNSK